MKKKVLLFGVLLCCNFATFANQTDELFLQGNEAFQKNDFENAMKLYEQVLASGYRSAELEYNLGNAYYRLNRTGKAILHFERALVLSPNDADVLHNISLARQRVQDDIDPLPEFFLAKWWRKLRNLAGSHHWGMLTIVFWWSGVAGLFLWKSGKNRRHRKIGFAVGLTFLALSLLPLALAMSRANYDADTNFAIVLEKTTSLRSAPDEAGSNLLDISEGTKVKLLEQLSGWWQVKLENGETGWLKSDVLEEI